MRSSNKPKDSTMESYMDSTKVEVMADNHFERLKLACTIGTPESRALAQKLVTKSFFLVNVGSSAYWSSIYPFLSLFRFLDIPNLYEIVPGTFERLTDFIHRRRDLFFDSNGNDILPRIWTDLPFSPRCHHYDINIVIGGQSQPICDGDNEHFIGWISTQGYFMYQGYLFHKFNIRQAYDIKLGVNITSIIDATGIRRPGIYCASNCGKYIIGLEYDSCTQITRAVKLKGGIIVNNDNLLVKTDTFCELIPHLSNCIKYRLNRMVISSSVSGVIGEVEESLNDSDMFNDPDIDDIRSSNTLWRNLIKQRNNPIAFCLNDVLVIVSMKYQSIRLIVPLCGNRWILQYNYVNLCLPHLFQMPIINNRIWLGSMWNAPRVTKVLACIDAEWNRGQTDTIAINDENPVKFFCNGRNDSGNLTVVGIDMAFDNHRDLTLITCQTYTRIPGSDSMEKDHSEIVTHNVKGKIDMDITFIYCNKLQCIAIPIPNPICM